MRAISILYGPSLQNQKTTVIETLRDTHRSSSASEASPILPEPTIHAEPCHATRDWRPIMRAQALQHIGISKAIFSCEDRWQHTL